MDPIDCADLYSDPQHYDMQQKEFIEDIPFYIRQTEQYGDPILELACGTGRITLRLAEEDYQITGLDMSKPMLVRAKEKASRRDVDVTWVHADCRDFNLDTKFNLILFPYNSLLHLHDIESYEACFSCVKHHLKEEGRFLIDIFTPDLEILMRDPTEKFPTAEYTLNGQKVTVTEQTSYNNATQLMHIKWHYQMGDKEWVKEWKNRILFPREIDTLLRYNGFTIEKKYGNYDEQPFSDGAKKQLIVCHNDNI